MEAAAHIDAEIIVVDDGSADVSARVVEDQIAKTGDTRTHLIRQESNRGIVEALNRGLDAARGRFIARMDADDICMPNRFARQLAFLEKTGIDLCGSWFVEFGQGMSRAVRWPHSEPALKAAMLFQNTICHPTVMARRKVFEKYRYREEYRLAEDYDLFARASADFHMANVPESLLHYRRHPEQATRARRAQMEEITRRIRIEALQAQGIDASAEEQRIHNLIRAPQSNHSMEDFERIEAWLLKLMDRFEEPDARRVVASQWTRAAIRAAPLGKRMWRKYRTSSLHGLLGKSALGDIDLAILAATRLDYGSSAFETLRRFGLSSA
jgi:glycosyltransferase involved in cell wall biosynthesis